jgi:predicted anti-sigma-YlaC factor YlaD
MTCERIEELLSAYLEGELGAVERGEVDSHLAACPACAGLLAGLRELTVAMAAFPEAEPSPSLMSRLYAIPGRNAEKKRRFRPVFDFLTRPALQPVYAAFTVLLVAMSFVLFHPEGQDIRKKIDVQFHRSVGTVEKLYAETGTLSGELGEFTGNVVKSFKSLDLLKGSEDKE